jgi:membrane protein
MQLLRQTYNNIIKYDVMSHAAALAFYALLALPSLLLVLLALIEPLGLKDMATQRIGIAVGPQAAQGIDTLINNATGFPALIGLALVIYAATTFFARLKTALNNIWHINKKESFVKRWLKTRFSSLLMLLSLGFALLAATVIGIVLDTSHFWLNILISFLIFSFIFTSLFTFVPDTKVRMRASSLGGSITAIVFIIGREILSLYLSYYTTTGYGAANSLVALVLFVYVSSIIMLAGAQLTHTLDQTLAKH